MRGEFIRGDGLVLPNNVSLEGARLFLASIFKAEPITMFMGLCSGAPTPGMTSADVLEPLIGTNGYTRQAIARNAIDWPVEGVVGSERFIESKTITFEATGTGFSRAVSRVMILGTGVNNPLDPIYMLGSALPEPLTIVPTTLLIQRQFKYRLYL